MIDSYELRMTGSFTNPEILIGTLPVGGVAPVVARIVCHFLARALRTRTPAIAIKRMIGIMVEGDLNARARIRLPILPLAGRNQRDL